MPIKYTATPTYYNQTQINVLICVFHFESATNVLTLKHGTLKFVWKTCISHSFKITAGI